MRKQVLGGLLASLLLAGFVAAVEWGNNSPTSRGTSQGDKMTTSSSSSANKECPVEKHIAACLSLDNQEVVLVGGFAANRARTAVVKDFANSLVKNHTQLVSQFHRLAPEAISTDDLVQLVSNVCSGQGEGYSARRSSSSRGNSMKKLDSTTRIERPSLGDESTSEWNNPQSSTGTDTVKSDTGNRHGTKDSGTSSGGWQNTFKVFSDIQHNAVANCICLTQTTLSQYPNEQFDKAFIYQQIGANIGLLAKFRAVKPYVSGDLKTFVDSGEKTAQNNLDRANSILKNWENNTSTAVGKMNY
jgi:hypothetical protein